MGHLRATPLTPVLAAIAMAGLLWMVLPMQPPVAAGEPSTADCLTLADSPSNDLNALERCHALVPADVELAADLGAAYQAAGRSGEAVAIYRQIIERDPLYAEIRLRLARLLREQGDEPGARSQIDAALLVQPNRRALTEFASGDRP